MLAKPRRRRQAPDLETNTAPDTLHDDPRQMLPDALVPGEDTPPSDYEREIDRLDAATRVER